MVNLIKGQTDEPEKKERNRKNGFRSGKWPFVSADRKMASRLRFQCSLHLLTFPEKHFLKKLNVKTTDSEIKEAHSTSESTERESGRE